MKLALTLAVLLSMSTAAMACPYDKSAQNAAPQTSQQATSQQTASQQTASNDARTSAPTRPN